MLPQMNDNLSITFPITYEIWIEIVCKKYEPIVINLILKKKHVNVKDIVYNVYENEKEHTTHLFFICLHYAVVA